MKPRVEVWNHFSKFVNKDGRAMCKCNYYAENYICSTKNGTTGRSQEKYKQKRQIIGVESKTELDK